MNGYQFADYGSGVSHAYRRSTIDRIDNFLEYLQDTASSALARTPDSEVSPYLLGFNQMFNDVKTGINITLQVGLGAPRILTNDYYLPNLIDAGNKVLAEAKYETQLAIAQVGGYGMRKGGIVGNYIHTYAAATYVGVEILMPGNLGEAALIVAGPGLGKLTGAGIKVLTKVPFLGADIGVVSRSAGVFVGAGSEALLSKASGKFGLPSLSMGIVDGSKVAYHGALLDTATGAAKNIVDELFRIPGVKSSNRMRPGDICFTQDTVSPNFSDGGTISEAVAGLRSGRIKPDDFPAVRVVEKDGVTYSLDNRRLATFSAAQVDDIPVQRLSLSDPDVTAEFLKKFKPIEGGQKIVVVPKADRAAARRILNQFGKYD